MKKILVWGTGKYARELVDIGVSANIVGFVETDKKNDEFRGFPVYEARNIPVDYDHIVVANTHSIEIYHYAQQIELDRKKMIFYKFCPYYDARKEHQTVREVLGDRLFQRYCNEYQLIEESSFPADKKLYAFMNNRPSFAIEENHIWPVIGDRFKNAGDVNNYFWQDLWAARLVLQNQPRQHYDIGSRLDGFIAHLLSARIPVKMIDIRPFPVKVEGLDTVVDDATTLFQFEDDSIESLSALCSLEHFGLGRYGDPIDPEACFTCFDAISKKMKAGGHVYLSVPVGKERVEFNAHRVFYVQTIIDCFSCLKLVEFAYTANGELEAGKDIHKYDNDMHDGEYRYGLFHFLKQK